MRFIDAHLHTDMVEDAQLQKLVMMGMEAAVIPSPHMFLGSHDADTVLLLWERFLTMEANTATTLGYEAFSSLSVPFFGVNHADAEKCLARLPEFLSHERVVAIGEIGLDCGTDFEVELFREHLRLARAHDLPVILHTPIRLAPQGATITPEILRDHRRGRLSGRTLRVRPLRRGDPRLSLSTGGMVGLSVCWDKMPPEAAARCVIDHPERARPAARQLRAGRPGQRLLHGAARHAGDAAHGRSTRRPPTRSAGRRRTTSSGCPSREGRPDRRGCDEGGAGERLRHRRQARRRGRRGRHRRRRRAGLADHGVHVAVADASAERRVGDRRRGARARRRGARPHGRCHRRRFGAPLGGRRAGGLSRGRHPGERSRSHGALAGRGGAHRRVAPCARGQRHRHVRLLPGVRRAHDRRRRRRDHRPVVGAAAATAPDIGQTEYSASKGADRSP